MKFEEIKQSQTYAQIADKLGISKSNLWEQVNTRGFSKRTIRDLLRGFPDIDVPDLLNNYPRSGKNGKENTT